jgi:hypothetical protein
MSEQLVHRVQLTEERSEIMRASKAVPIQLTFRSNFGVFFGYYPPLRVVGKASDMLKSKSFRIITEPHIPAIRHLQPIDAAANPILAVSTNPRSDVRGSDRDPHGPLPLELPHRCRGCIRNALAA